MKKNSAIFVCILASSFALTASSGGWKAVSEEEVVKESPADIYQTLASEPSSFGWLSQDHVNRQLAGIKPDILTKMNIKITKLRWEGESKCAPDDPRLEKKLLSGSIHRASGSSEGFTDMMTKGEPCP